MARTARFQNRAVIAIDTRCLPARLLAAAINVVDAQRPDILKATADTLPAKEVQQCLA
jgi:hypothetical protein